MIERDGIVEDVDLTYRPGAEPDPRRLRTELRRRRAALSIEERAQRSARLVRHIERHASLLHRERIALYLPVNAEPDLTALIPRLWERGRTPWLPVLRPAPERRLWFAPLRRGTALVANRYGIPEPQVPYRSLLRPFELDLVLLPLVGFDARGNRLGMGGGYYDRSFAYRLHRRAWQRPLLIGTAFACQQVDHLPVRPWDVPLDAVVTERGVLGAGD